jgi:hypothetical protein
MRGNKTELILYLVKVGLSFFFWALVACGIVLWFGGLL